MSMYILVENRILLSGFQDEDEYLMVSSNKEKIEGVRDRLEAIYRDSEYSVRDIAEI